MSEYQYYEFQAVDRALTERAMRKLRGYSSRATITPTRFVNHYEWGDFKGDPAAWMERYFDAFLYLANWGTHALVLRLPGACSTSRRPGGTWPARPPRRASRAIMSFLSFTRTPTMAMGGTTTGVDGCHP